MHAKIGMKIRNGSYFIDYSLIDLFSFRFIFVWLLAIDAYLFSIFIDSKGLENFEPMLNKKKGKMH